MALNLSVQVIIDFTVKQMGVDQVGSPNKAFKQMLLLREVPGFSLARAFQKLLFKYQSVSKVTSLIPTVFKCLLILNTHDMCNLI